MEKLNRFPRADGDATPLLESLICDLLETESSRYALQAKELLHAGALKIHTGDVLIKYKFSEGHFYYQYNKNVDGSLQESETLAPELYEDQISSLVFMFALSEAGASI